MKMKTAVTVLQEMMVKLGQAPEYECIAKAGPAHQAQFTVACRAGGVAASATARSKKEAKQEAARRALELLAAGALEPPPPRSRLQPAPAALPAAVAPPALPAAVAPPPRSHVALLAELCDHMGLLAPVYEEVSADGPPHSRVFTWTAHVGGVVRRGVARSKKAARQLAAASLYQHLRTNLPQHAETFDEEAALVRAHERAMERYVAVAPERTTSPLALPLAQYGKALSASIDEPRRLAALAALSALPDECGAEEVEAGVRAAAAALGLALEALVLPPRTSVLALAGAAPPLAAGAAPPHAPARAALRLLRRLLRHPAPPAAALAPDPAAALAPDPAAALAPDPAAALAPDPA